MFSELLPVRITRLTITLLFAALAALLGLSAAHAAPCQNTQDFKVWLAEFRREAEAEGISRRAVAARRSRLMGALIG